MNRPAPRKSSLTGSNPIAPPAAAATEPAEVAAPPAPVEKAQSKPASKPAAATVEAKKYRPKVSFYQDPADTDRVRGAILHTQVQEGSRSLSKFIDDAVMEKVAALEAKYNGGQPFPAIGARELPQGRPMGE
ncbi:ParB family protein [Plantibacter auratus]|uniref:ParB family protein n=1 Tax=Plantibacter auratus TaxID=272914 RepID=UPI003D3364E6